MGAKSTGGWLVKSKTPINVIGMNCQPGVGEVFLARPFRFEGNNFGS